jgi:hypothetical protein
MKNYKVYKLFPTPIFHLEVENFKKLNIALENYILDLKKKDKDGQKNQTMEVGTLLSLIKKMITHQRNLLTLLKIFL